MKLVLLIWLMVGCTTTLFARHGKGGYLTYEYIGEGTTANTSQYRITVLHYVNCRESGFELESVFVGIYRSASRQYVNKIEIRRTSQQYIQKKQFDGCISPVPEVCFFLAYYVGTIELTNSEDGYILSEQECCRADDIINLINPRQMGSTNANNIPGIINNTDYHTNSNPSMALKDTAVICHNSYFELDFGTTDPDGDQLTYSFCNATVGGSQTDRQPNPPSPPPYASVLYANGYSGYEPMGAGVKIDSKTGLIKGIAPAATGAYIIAVCITEYRNGIALAVTKKEIMITVADCSLSAATLEPQYINCDNFSFTFQNESYANDIATYRWDFGTAVSDPSLLTQPTPTFTYKDTGTYHIKLVVTSGTNCTDSATSVVKIYPGFKAGFSVAGSCYQSPFLFTDASYARYGNITSYSWNFGDPNTAADTSHSKKVAYQYTTAGNVTAALTVSSDKGCIDTETKTIVVNNKPQIIAPFTDTLICRNDQLPLHVTTSGTEYHWSPDYNISSTTLLAPVVYPEKTTVYTLTVQDKQCIDSIQLRVNVIDTVTLHLPPQIEICATDTVMLQPQSDGLSYTWREEGATRTLSNARIKNPLAYPLQNTAYYLTASVGHCSANAQTRALVSPYPTGNAGADTIICFGATVQLHGTTAVAHYAWSPAETLLNENTLTPLAGPQYTTAYILSVSDTFYCKKNVYDTVLVTVQPQLYTDAGRDTSATLGEPLQLQATASEDASFKWWPATGMYSNEVANPVLIINDASVSHLTYGVEATTAKGCTATDSVHITLFAAQPDLYFPSAFTPDNNGRNDVFRPVAPGISELTYFRIFNRLGQLLFETSRLNEGWNGLFQGKRQPPGTYVYTAEAKDYTGKRLLKKGTLVLVR